MKLKRIVLAAACATSFAIAACSSSGGSGPSTGGDGGGGTSTSTNSTSSSGGSNPGNCPTYHACQFLTSDQVNAVIGSGGADAGFESNNTTVTDESTSCLYMGSTGNLSIALTCGQQLSAAQVTAEQGDASVTSVPNLGMQALAIGDHKLYVFATSSVSFQVTVTGSGGTVPANALDTAKTVATEVIAKL